MRYRVIEEDGKRKVVFYEKRGWKGGRQKITLPAEKILRLRREGYSLRQIAVILKVEDGISVSYVTVYRELKKLEEQASGNSME